MRLFSFYFIFLLACVASFSVGAQEDPASAAYQTLSEIDEQRQTFLPLRNAMLDLLKDDEINHVVNAWLMRKSRENVGYDGRYQLIDGGALMLTLKPIDDSMPERQKQNLRSSSTSAAQNFYAGYLKLLDNRSYCEDQTSGQKIQGLGNLFGAQAVMDWAKNLSAKEKERLYNDVVEVADASNMHKLNWVCHDGMQEKERYSVEDYICEADDVEDVKSSEHCEVKESVVPMFTNEDQWQQRKAGNREHIRQMIVGS